VSQSAPTHRGELLLFARNFLKHPRMLGSLIPSSRFLIDEVLQAVDWANARVIVEYGPGVGTFTAEVLRRMRPDASLIAIETNTDFVRFLKSSISDPRLQVVLESAENTDKVLRDLGHVKADYVISGVPLGSMQPELRRGILNTTHSVLDPRGSFLVYQFTTRVLPDLQRIFRLVERRFEPLNILPAQVFFCQPRSA
jgi:phospholipid N-methyltransferase